MQTPNATIVHILSFTFALGVSPLLQGCGDDGPEQTGGTDAETSETGITGTSQSDSSTSGTESTDESTGEPTPTTGGASTDSTGADSTGAEPGLEIVGDWIEAFPGGGQQTHAITELDWTMVSDFGTSIHHIDSYDNETDTLIAQGDAANAFNPEAWGKFQWTQDVNGDLWYCQVVFDAASAAEAAAGADADPTDPATGGCGDFPWSALTPG